MLSAAVCAMAFSANADVADVAEDVEVIESAQSSAFNSIYFGAGIGGSFLKCDNVDILEKQLGSAVSLEQEANGSYRPNFSELPAEKGKFGVKANRFTGSLVIGAGKVFSNNVYIGGEFLVDLSKNEKISRENPIGTYVSYREGFDKLANDEVVRRTGGKTVGEFKSLYEEGFDANRTLDAARKDVKIGGFMPQVNLKAGYVFKNNTLVYGKLGCALTKVSVDSYYKERGSDEWIKNKDESFSKTKPSLILGLGAEKAFGKKISAAVEADYNFGWKHKGYKANKGWNVRALVKYNVKY